LPAIKTIILNQNIKKIRDVVTRLASEHRDFHSSVSKVGKAIDKNFIPDLECVENKSFVKDNLSQNALNQVIIEHFLRKGMLDTAEEMIKEIKLDISEAKKYPFYELNHIIDSLKRRDLGPALEWAEKNKNKLEERNSSLKFKLHRLQFIDYLSKGLEKQKELIQYARNHLQILATRHEKEIQTLMGSLLYLRSGIEQSPYAYLLDPLNWNEICDIFTRDACALLGMSVESPLSMAFEAGSVALSSLLNIKQVMQQRKVANAWASKDELPIVINLGRKYQFHSIFSCPILRQQSSDSNPPMRLVCGHAISRDALNKLANGSSKFKCPYCPIEQNPQSARQIFF
jgi:protein RMD5 homolog A